DWSSDVCSSDLARERRFEEIAVAMHGALDQIPFSGDVLQAAHVIDLDSAPVARRDAADGQRAADGETEIASQYWRHEAVLQRLFEQAVPAQASIDLGGAVADLVDLAEGGHLDHEPAAHQRLAVRRVTLTAGGDLDAKLLGEAHHLDDVFDRAGAQQGERGLMNGVAHVARVGGEHGRVEDELPV